MRPYIVCVPIGLFFGTSIFALLSNVLPNHVCRPNKADQDLVNTSRLVPSQSRCGTKLPLSEGSSATFYQNLPIAASQLSKLVVTTSLAEVTFDWYHVCELRRCCGGGRKMSCCLLLDMKKKDIDQLLLLISAVVKC